MAIPTVAVLVAFAVFLILRSKFKLSRRPPLPPGPPADPFIGHIRVIPDEKQGEVFHSWAKLYGDVIHLHIPGTSMVILNSVQAANELLDKRGLHFSSRQRFRVYELMGWVPNVVLLPYGRRFFKHRRMLQYYFNKKECQEYQPLQLRQAGILLKNLLVHSNNYDMCLQRFATASIVRVAYGHDVVSDNDEFIELASTPMADAVNSPGPPGNTPIDWIPVLQYFPSWFPGTYYATLALSMRRTVRRLYDDPVERIQKLIVDEAAPSCILTTELQKLKDKHDPQDVDDIKGLGAVVYSAGLDTTWGSLGVFLYIMVVHPEFQKKAQEELDAVVGSDRLPDFSDRSKLPYVEAIVQEVFRWKPVVPLGIPHRSTRDEVYRDMFIPKDSIVIANAVGMSLDKNVYSDPHKFNPERFLDRSGKLAEPYFTAAFGFGRRICPGRFFADAGIWIAAASILATFEISKAVGKDGKEITPVLEHTPQAGFVIHLKQVPCVIRPRSSKHEALINKFA